MSTNVPGYWVTRRPPRPSLFPVGPRGYHRYRPPSFCKPGFILSRASAPLQSSSCDAPARIKNRSLSSEHLPWDFGSPSRHSSSESTQRPAFPRRATVRPRCFSHPRRFTPHCTSAVYFTRKPRPRLPSSGVSPDSQPEMLVTSRALLSLTSFA